MPESELHPKQAGAYTHAPPTPFNLAVYAFNASYRYTCSQPWITKETFGLYKSFILLSFWEEVIYSQFKETRAPSRRLPVTCLEMRRTPCTKTVRSQHLLAFLGHKGTHTYTQTDTHICNQWRLCQHSLLHPAAAILNYHLSPVLHPKTRMVAPSMSASYQSISRRWIKTWKQWQSVVWTEITVRRGWFVIQTAKSIAGAMRVLQTAVVGMRRDCC